LKAQIVKRLSPRNVCSFARTAIRASAGGLLGQVVALLCRWLGQDAAAPMHLESRGLE